MGVGNGLGVFDLLSTWVLVVVFACIKYFGGYLLSLWWWVGRELGKFALVCSGKVGL